MIIFLAVIFLLILFSLAWGGLSLIIWLPTHSKDLKRILALAELKPGELFYDLGCGDGRVAAFISKNSQAEVIGLEIAWPLFLICRLRQIFRPQANLVFKHGNLFKENLNLADAVYVFGIPEKLETKLRPKLEKELKPEARVISYAFSIKGWQPEITDKPTEKDIPIFLYTR